jgi:hypothetical protein
MSQTPIAGGPVGVARVNPPRRSHKRNANSTSQRAAAAIGLVVRVLAGAAIVEAVAVASFGFAVGTVIAGLEVLAIGVAFLAYRGFSGHDGR